MMDTKNCFIVVDLEQGASNMDIKVFIAKK